MQNRSVIPMMSSRRMLTRRQCVFVVVVLPMLIIPAFVLLRIADPKPETAYFILPKKVPVNPLDMHKNANIAAAQRVPKPRPKKCYEYIWSGTCHDTCHNYNIKAKQKQRRQKILKCEKSKTVMKTLYTAKPKQISKMKFKDPCLRKAVDWYCHDNKRVPNIVHYVWFGKLEFEFIHFLSFLSVHKFQNPCLIMVHADRMPRGALWRYFLQISPSVIQVQRKQPKKIFKKKVQFIEHKADIAKLEALREYGGIYLDTDQVLLKSIDRFRNNDATIAMEYESTVSNSIIMAKKNASFLKYWYDSYKTYKGTEGNTHSNKVPYLLSRKHRDLVRVVGSSFAAPTSKQLSLLYSKNSDWSKQYGMHLHLKLREKFYGNKFNFDTIKSLNTTAGAVARHILYGNTDMCPAKTIIQ